LVAFDTSPGNALLYDVMHARTGKPSVRTALRPNLERPIARPSSRFATVHVRTTAAQIARARRLCGPRSLVIRGGH
jgi:hypothetical protein